MGKVMVVGKAEREYSADRCELDLEISVLRKTASEASAESGRQCELLLAGLKEIGIAPESVTVRHDVIEKQFRYDTNEVSYDSRKTLCVRVPADIALISAVRGVIENGFENVALSARFSVSDEAERKRSLLKDAIADSRAKAELLAESMGCRIAGIDSANLSGQEDVYDVTEEETENDGLRERYLSAKASGSANPLTDRLTPEKIALQAEVRVVWELGDAV